MMDLIWCHLMHLKKYEQKETENPSPFYFKIKSLFHIKPIKHHDFVPSIYEIIYKFLFAIYS